LNKNTTLTIAVPCFNGADKISTLLDSIFLQLDGIDEVEVLVSDNASTDNLQVIVNKYEQISYYCNEQNLGPDRNIVLAIERSKGKYVWVIGDDDYLAEGAIEYILQALKNNEDLGAIFVNFCLYDTKNNYMLKDKWLEINEDVYCENADEFLSVTGVSPNFLSSMVHNKACFLAVDYEKYFGTYWAQYGTLLDYLQNKSTLCIAEPYVVNAGDSTDGVANVDGRSLLILCNLMKIVLTLPDDVYSQDSKMKSANAVKLLLTRKICSAKRLGLSLNYELLKTVSTYFGGNVFFWIIQLPLLLLPKIVHKGIYSFYKMKWINSCYWKFKQL